MSICDRATARSNLSFNAYLKSLNSKFNKDSKLEKNMDVLTEFQFFISSSIHYFSRTVEKYIE